MEVGRTIPATTMAALLANVAATGARTVLLAWPVSQVDMGLRD